MSQSDGRSYFTEVQKQKIITTSHGSAITFKFNNSVQLYLKIWYKSNALFILIKIKQKIHNLNPRTGK